MPGAAAERSARHGWRKKQASHGWRGPQSETAFKCQGGSPAAYARCGRIGPSFPLRFARQTAERPQRGFFRLRAHVADVSRPD